MRIQPNPNQINRIGSDLSPSEPNMPPETVIFFRPNSKKPNQPKWFSPQGPNSNPNSQTLAYIVPSILKFDYNYFKMFEGHVSMATPRNQILLLHSIWSSKHILGLHIIRYKLPSKEPMGEAWLQFWIRYYMFALVFVVDVEMVFLYPHASH